MSVSDSLIITRRYATPCGDLILGDHDGRLCLAVWAADSQPASVVHRVCRHLRARLRDGSTPLLDQAGLQLDQYFRGERREFDVPLLPIGTDFQQRAWRQLQTIPYGTTITYGEQAAAMGQPTATRAIAHANGQNAISIFIPCHRVIGADGKLTGYAGGIEAKRWLTDWERAHLPTP